MAPRKVEYFTGLPIPYSGMDTISARRPDALSERETWQVALDALRANKVKAALTMLGVVIGSAASCWW